MGTNHLTLQNKYQILMENYDEYCGGWLQFLTCCRLIKTRMQILMENCDGGKLVTICDGYCDGWQQFLTVVCFSKYACKF